MGRWSGAGQARVLAANRVMSCVSKPQTTYPRIVGRVRVSEEASCEGAWACRRQFNDPALVCSVGPLGVGVFWRQRQRHAARARNTEHATGRRQRVLRTVCLLQAYSIARHDLHEYKHISFEGRFTACRQPVLVPQHTDLRESHVPTPPPVRTPVSPSALSAVSLKFAHAAPEER